MIESEEVRDALLDRHVAALAEHFDSVVIIVTSHGEGRITEMGARGGGNVYAQLGSARDWIARQDAINRRHAAETYLREDDYDEDD
jgi:hypothetical protein